MLDRNNYYATTGGHGACRGCGEVTAIRLVTGANHAIHDKRRKEHIRELEGLIEQLNAKLRDGARTASTIRRGASASRRRIATLEKRLYLLRERPDRQRPGQHGDRQRHRLQQRVRLDLPVQPLQRSVGQQPVPGHARRSPRASSRA